MKRTVEWEVHPCIRYIFLFIVALSIGSCSESTSVGAGLLSDEDLSIDFTDTVDITGKTIYRDSVLVYDSQMFSPGFLLLGNYSDPYFGQYISSLYAEAVYNTADPGYDLTDEIDSIVLILSLDTELKFGDTMALHNIEVYSLNERINASGEVYSNRETVINETPIAVLEEYSLNFDSLNVYNPALDSTVLEKPGIRIPLSEEFISEIKFLLIGAENVDEFVEVFKGIHVRSRSETNSMYNIVMTASELESRMAVYYTRGDTAQLIYEYPLAGVRYNHFDHDYSGSLIEEHINDPVSGENLLYLQGMSGVDIEFNISEILNLQDVLLNYVEVELTLAEFPDDDLDIYLPVEGLVASKINSQGELEEIEDFELGITTNNLEFFFGGSLEESEENGNLVRKYKMNITNHVKSLQGSDPNTTLIISVFNTLNYPNRSIIYGPGHPDFPAKVNITYTRL